MVFWYFGTAFLGESHHADGEDLRSTAMILHPIGAAEQGGFSVHVHSNLYAREASAASAAQFRRGYRRMTEERTARTVTASVHRKLGRETRSHQHYGISGQLI
jgi:hypothetical protein